MRLRWLTLALLLIAAPAYGFDFLDKDGRVTTGLQPGTSASATVTSGGSGFIGVTQCSRTTLEVKCTAGPGACSLVGWRCPWNVTTADPDECTEDSFQDSSGTVQTELTGDVLTLRDLNEIDPTPRLVAVVTGSGRALVTCR